MKVWELREALDGVDGDAVVIVQTNKVDAREACYVKLKTARPRFALVGSGNVPAIVIDMDGRW